MDVKQVRSWREFFEGGEKRRIHHSAAPRRHPCHSTLVLTFLRHLPYPYAPQPRPSRPHGTNLLSPLLESDGLFQAPHSHTELR